MAAEAVLALDQGSSSTRVLAFDSKGRVLARSKFPVRTFLPRPGWVEHDPVELARTSERALDCVLQRLPSKVRVIGLGIASQRSTFVMWDSRTGRPVGRAPSWQDGRAAEGIAALQSYLRYQGEVHAKTGLYLVPYYSAPKIRYQLETLPEARRLADEGRLRIGPVSSFILWRLSGGRCFRTDPAMAQRMLLYNLRQGGWDDGLLEEFRVPRACLPEIVTTAGAWGTVECRGRRIPVLAVMGDQQSAALGQGVDEPGIGVLNYGTGAFFLFHTGESLHSLPGLLTSVAWSRAGRPCRYFLEGTVNAAGPSLRWLHENLKLLGDARGADRACRKSKNRLFALQALGGLGAPRWDPLTPTVLWGLNRHSTREDVVRAVVESIAYLISDIVVPIRSAGLEVRELRASGGLARIESLLQVQADLLQQSIARLKEQEATAMGVATLAAEEAGVSWSSSIRRIALDRTFEAKVDAASAEKRLEGWRRFVSAQQKLAVELKGLGLL